VEEKSFLSEIEQHKGILIKISRAYQVNVSDQEDLFQEMVYQLWRSRKQFKGNSQYSTWLYRVCLNTALNYLSKQPKVITSELSAKNEQSLQSKSEYPSEDLKMLYAAIQKLSPIEKAIMLMVLDGIKQETIAKNLGLTHTHIRVKINRSKAKLKQRLIDMGYE
jgi:RNA polymerase sigma factor (sigma-70 family)